MNLLELYKHKNDDKKWFEDHFSLGDGRGGRMFEYTNTNFRTQNSFTSQFQSFLEIENKERSSWPRQANHGQEVHKQHVNNMLQSKLFKKDSNDIFSRTTKGNLYNEFINEEHEENARWFLNYIFLLNGYYFNRKNYIIYRVKEDILGHLLSIDGVDESILIKYAVDILKIDSFEKMIRSPFFYLHSFYNDSDFLINYLRSTENDREELAKYIEENRKNENYVCCISAKYKLSGNFNKNMLVDETKVFLLTLLFIKSKNINTENIYDVFTNNYHEYIYPINKEIASNYLRKNKDVFNPIFIDILEIEEVDTGIYDVVEKIEIDLKSLEDKAEDYIDETSEIGRQRIKAVFSLRKKQARIQSGYTCALENINNCKPIYFTSKINGKTYLELHHFVPREFRNDFSYSIEVLANYVTLCPRCHRQIHLASDRERKHLINALYNERKDRLKIVGLDLELPKIYEYYKIDS